MKGTTQVHLAHPPAIKQAYATQAQTVEIILYVFGSQKKKTKQNIKASVIYSQTQE